MTWKQRHLLRIAAFCLAFFIPAIIIADIASQGGIRAGLRGATHCTIWTNEDGTTTRHYTRGFPKFVIKETE